MGLRDDILGADDRPWIDVPTPEWPVKTVRIISMSGADRDSWEASALIRRASLEGTDRLRNLRAELVGRCAVDPTTGERIFGENDIEALGGKSAKVLERLFAAATQLNAVSDEDMKALEKNFGRGPSGASHFALRWLRAASTWIGSFRSSPAVSSPSGRPSSDSRVIH